MLKDRSITICQSKGNPANIEDLLGIIESIIWSTQPLNLGCLQEFSALMMSFFGAQTLDVSNSPKVDPDLK